MSIIHEVATMTSKGQITVPKPIRQALGVDAGAKVAFELEDDGRVVVTRADADTEHHDPAIGAFLDLLERDIEAGNVHELPEDLAQAMRSHAESEIDLDEPIHGDIAL